VGVFELPLRSGADHFQFGIRIEGTNYEFEFRWNYREEAWYFDLRLEDGTEIVLGVKVVVDWPLGRRSMHPKRLPGALIAVDTAGLQKDPGLNDLGSRVQLQYLDAVSLREALLEAKGKV
jgi:hypothetical protein